LAGVPPAMTLFHSPPNRGAESLILN
jgi:hypothetical protein